MDTGMPARPWLWLLSLGILYHLASLFVEPMTIFSRTSVRPIAADVALIRPWFSPYTQSLYLDHGYFFFAPNPGPNHLLQCDLTTSKNAQPPIRLTLPDRKEHWPRLYYHRHFMFSEFYHNLFAPQDAPRDAAIDPVIADQWKRDRMIYQAVQQSVIRHLQYQYPDHDVSLSRWEHLLPDEHQVLAEGWELTDPRLYQRLPESYGLEALPANPLPPNPQPMDASSKSEGPEAMPTKKSED